MDGWNTTFLLGRPIFRCELLVSGRVSLTTLQKYPMEATWIHSSFQVSPRKGLFFLECKVSVEFFSQNLGFVPACQPILPLCNRRDPKRIEGGSRSSYLTTCLWFLPDQHVNECVMGTIWEWNDIYCIRYTVYIFIFTYVCISWTWSKHVSNIYIMHSALLCARIYIYTHDHMIYIYNEYDFGYVHIYEYMFIVYTWI